MDIVIIKEPITRAELKKIAEKRFGDLVKAAVDIKNEVMAVGGDLHIDCMNVLINNVGSKNPYTWGVNIFPEETGDGFIQFDSMINYKANFGNRTRGVDNTETKQKVVEVIHKLVI